MARRLVKTQMFLDIRNCGSSVAGYVEWPYISRSGYVHGGGLVRLSDCGRTITWDIVASRGGVMKLTRAIMALEKLRAALEASQERHEELTKRAAEIRREKMRKARKERRRMRVPASLHDGDY